MFIPAKDKVQLEKAAWCWFGIGLGSSLGSETWVHRFGYAAFAVAGLLSIAAWIASRRATRETKERTMV